MVEKAAVATEQEVERAERETPEGMTKAAWLISQGLGRESFEEAMELEEPVFLFALEEVEREMLQEAAEGSDLTSRQWLLRGIYRLAEEHPEEVERCSSLAEMGELALFKYL